MGILRREPFRRGSTAYWTALNPVLLDGEPGWDRTLAKGKVGDGVTEWTELPWSLGVSGGSGEGGAVTTVAGRAGDVVLDLADVADTAAFKRMTDTERAKLAGVATGATANATDAQLRDRTTHTGSIAQANVTNLTTDLGNKAALTHLHTASQVSDFTEATEDVIAALFARSTHANLSWTYTDNGSGVGTLAGTATATGGSGLDAEGVRDSIGTALQAVGLVSVAVNDPGDTITISTTATQNSTDAFLRDRANHTGFQSLDTTTDSATRLAMTTAERSKLGGVATGATANASDAQLRDRALHTGDMPQANVSGLATALGALAPKASPAFTTSATLDGQALVKTNDARLSDARTPTTHAHVINDTTGLQTALDAKVAEADTVNTQTGTAYTLVAADAGKDRLLLLNNAAATTVTVNAGVVPAGWHVPLAQFGAGQVTVVQGSGVTIKPRGDAFKLAGQGAMAELVCVATDSFILTGDLVV